MSLLLDTNALVWASDKRKVKNLGRQAQRLITSGDLIYFSPISIAELQIKSMTGKFKDFPRLAEQAKANAYLELNYIAAHAEAMENFPSLIHHDPFDRMLLAQAFSEGLTFLASDKLLLGLGLDFVVDASK